MRTHVADIGHPTKFTIKELGNKLDTRRKKGQARRMSNVDDPTKVKPISRKNM